MKLKNIRKEYEIDTTKSIDEYITEISAILKEIDKTYYIEEFLVTVNKLHILCYERK